MRCRGRIKLHRCKHRERLRLNPNQRTSLDARPRANPRPRSFDAARKSLSLKGLCSMRATPHHHTAVPPLYNTRRSENVTSICAESDVSTRGPAMPRPPIGLAAHRRQSEGCHAAHVRLNSARESRRGCLSGAGIGSRCHERPWAGVRIRRRPGTSVNLELSRASVHEVR